MLKKEIINAVKINQLFHEISCEYGYAPEQYLDGLFNLIEPGIPCISVRFITDHNQLFGFKMSKYNRSSLSAIRKAVDKNIKDGDSVD